MKYSELKRKLKKTKKCYKVEEGGEHEKWYSEITGLYFRISRGTGDVPKGTLDRILKDAGL
ncbi:MAG: type II toxin-antitoxin system HicA family toxin [Oscillospiraceae bacterium]|nr:type II toxin-antitoxin system HicA family toxin [Oscillospiraceae bacterium]